MKIRTQIVSLLSIVFLPHSSPLANAESAYQLVQIADASADQVLARAALNNRGDVAFSVFDFEDFTTTIHVSDGNASSQMRTSPGQYATVFGLTDAGRVGLLSEAYDLNTFELIGQQLLIVRPPVLAGTPQIAAVTFPSYFAHVSFNNGGAVAFNVLDFPARDPRGSLYFAEKGGSITLIAQGSPDPSSHDGPGYLAINNSDGVAYTELGEPTLGIDPGVFVWKNGVSTRITDASVFVPEDDLFPEPGVSLFLFQGIAINDRGSVAVGTGSRILRWDEGTLTTIARVNQGGFIYPYKLNNGGLVVFSATSDPIDFRAPIFVGDGVTTRRVAGPGDVLWGKTVEAIAGEVDINERGQVAFPVLFSDGSSAVILATPVK